MTVKKHLAVVASRRRTAAKVSSKESKTMVRIHSSNHPSAVYFAKERVVVFQQKVRYVKGKNPRES